VKGEREGGRQEQVKLPKDWRREGHAKRRRVSAAVVAGSDAAAAEVMEGAMELRMSEAAERTTPSLPSSSWTLPLTCVWGGPCFLHHHHCCARNSARARRRKARQGRGQGWKRMDSGVWEERP